MFRSHTLTSEIGVFNERFRPRIRNDGSLCNDASVKVFKL